MQLWIAAGQPQAYNPAQFVWAGVGSNLTNQNLFSYILYFPNASYYSAKGYATGTAAAAAGLAILQSTAATVQLD